MIFAILWFSAVSYPQSVKPKVSQLCSDCVVKNPASDQVVSGPYELNLKDAGASLQVGPGEFTLDQNFFKRYFGLGRPRTRTTSRINGSSAGYDVGSVTEMECDGGGAEAYCFGDYRVVLSEGGSESAIGASRDVIMNIPPSTTIPLAVSYLGNLDLVGADPTSHVSAAYIFWDEGVGLSSTTLENFAGVGLLGHPHLAQHGYGIYTGNWGTSPTDWAFAFGGGSGVSAGPMIVGGPPFDYAASGPHTPDPPSQTLTPGIDFDVRATSNGPGIVNAAAGYKIANQASWSSGAAAPVGACVNGSTYSNTIGHAGSTWYLCIDGAWEAKY